ncbi:50S ribosomal protein L7/L12 [Patescibacteria group bacterium]|nr:50S ribosomal protein L7/L12 [Patescibacteria group bacterium]
MATEETKDVSAEASAKAGEIVEVPEKFKSLVESVEKLSVLELSELVKVLEKKFGVSAAAPVAVAQAPADDAGEAAEEKTSFIVQLNSVGDKKIEVIKTVRDATEKGLKEAKDIVDAAATEPQVVKEGIGKEEAEELKKKFVAAGATVELK